MLEEKKRGMVVNHSSLKLKSRVVLVRDLSRVASPACMGAYLPPYDLVPNCRVRPTTGLAKSTYFPGPLSWTESNLATKLMNTTPTWR